MSYSISVDLEVFKALTARIEADGQDHNDVLRDLLDLDSIIESAPIDSAVQSLADRISAFQIRGPGFFSRGLLLPNGTELRAKYKGKRYLAAIVDSKWTDSEGREYLSPSGAATAITDTNVNGWRFWEAKRPGDVTFRRLDVISAQ